MTWERKIMSKGGRLRLVDGSLQRGERRDAGADLVEEAVHLHVDADADGVGEADGVRAAMALHRDAVESEEDGAVVAPGIEPLTQLLERGRGKDIADACGQRMLERRAQELGEQPRRAFRGLQRDVAGEAVGDDDVDRAGGDVVPLDEAMEADGRAWVTQARGGYAQLLMALKS